MRVEINIPDDEQFLYVVLCLAENNKRSRKNYIENWFEYHVKENYKTLSKEQKEIAKTLSCVKPKHGGSNNHTGRNQKRTPM
jgi:hypothetical protein